MEKETETMNEVLFEETNREFWKLDEKCSAIYRQLWFAQPDGLTYNKLYRAVNEQGKKMSIMTFNKHLKTHLLAGNYVISEKQGDSKMLLQPVLFKVHPRKYYATNFWLETLEDRRKIVQAVLTKLEAKGADLFSLTKLTYSLCHQVFLEYMAQEMALIKMCNAVEPSYQNLTWFLDEVSFIMKAWSNKAAQRIQTDKAEFENTLKILHEEINKAQKALIGYLKMAKAIKQGA